jgi:hypothetical protein
MRIRKQNIERRAVIEAYAKYDCPRKGCATPAFATWDWSQADAIDKEMCGAHLKTGVPAGYMLWDEIELTVSDLRECAVDIRIVSGQSRRLGSVGAGELATWTPDRPAIWCKVIAGGHTFDETAPMLLRPAVSGESPACWYIEDGSGRAIAFLKNQHTFSPSQTLAIGYLGRKPDPHSSFMQKEFRELLCA